MNTSSNSIFSLGNMNNQCDISTDLIYHDSSGNQPMTFSKPKQTMTFSAHVLSEQKPKVMKPSFLQHEELDLCEMCSESLSIGEVVYYCLCEKFYHPNCLIKHNANYMTEICSACLSKYFTGVYKLLTPSSLLNNEEVTLDQNSTFERTICMDTNINKLGNYDHMCDLAFQMSPNVIAEMINNDRSNGPNGSNCKDELTRIALSPINLENTPYSGIKGTLVSSNKDYLPLQHTTTPPNHKVHFEAGSKTSQPGFGHSPDVSLNGVKQHLTFCSNNKNDSSKHSLTNSAFKLSNQSQSIFTFLEQSSSKGLSFRKLAFDDIEESPFHEDREEANDDDKENCPPLPKENSSYAMNSLNYQGDPSSPEAIEINIEAGLSHIVSNSNRTIEIPITIDLKLKEAFSSLSLYNYSKDTLLMFNTQELNIDTTYQIIKCVYHRMGDNDRMLSNIFNFNKWITKKEVYELLSDGNFASYYQESVALNYTEIAKLILFGIDLSFEFHSNIFSIVLINDLDDIPLDKDYMDELKTVSSKIKESSVALIKSFTINAIILDDKSKPKTQSTARFVSYLYDMSMLSMGYFYAPKDVNELIKSVALFYATIEQASLLNIRLNVKGNKDPSVYLEPINCVSKKKSHNNYEVYVGLLLKKERKTLNITASVVMNTSIALTLPLLEVSCEYLVVKPQQRQASLPVSQFAPSFVPLNGLSSNQSQASPSLFNLVIARTNYYPISIAVITQNKVVIESNTVFLKNICARICSEIEESISLFKAFKFDEAYQKLIDSKQHFDHLIKRQTCLFLQLKFASESSIQQTQQRTSMQEDSIMFNTSNINMSTILNQDGLALAQNMDKAISYLCLIVMDLNYLIDQAKNRNINSICQVLSIGESLSFFRCVVLGDDRFMEDNYENISYSYALTNNSPLK